VLVVEDEWLIAIAVADSLETAGFTVVGPAPTVDQALSLIAANAVECAVLDVTLSGTDSFPVADALDRQGVPFAFVTGYNRHDLPARFRERPVLVKPVPEPDLRRVVATLLSWHEVRRRAPFACRPPRGANYHHQ
jgi:DNA-binding response OmpR family regulator